MRPDFVMAEVGEATTERVLEEVELEIKNLEEYEEGTMSQTAYGPEEKWEKVKEVVEMMGGRTSEEEEKDAHGDYEVTTAWVHLEFSDRAVKEMGSHALRDCVNLWKIRAPFVEEVGTQAFSYCKNLVEAGLPNVITVNESAFEKCNGLCKVALPSARSIGVSAFRACYDLRHITLHPDVEVHRLAFLDCLSLEVLAASNNFEIDTGDISPSSGCNDPTRGITQYLKWRNESDAARKERMYTYMTMVKLCEHDEEDPKAPPPRAKPNDPIAKFLVECGEEGIVRTILSFFGETRGKGDLRGATKAELLAVGLDLKVLRKENNADNSRHWGVRVHANGEIIGSDDEESDDEESDDEESNDEESDDEESNDEESNDEESDDEESDSDY